MNEPYPSRRAAVLAVGAAAAFAVSPAQAAVEGPPARYRVTLYDYERILFGVEAELPKVGDRLSMGQSWPGELPEMDRRGWPAVVSGIEAVDDQGPLELLEGRNHWKLARPAVGPVRLTYGVDLSLFARAGWPSPLESAVVDGSTFSVSGRALFIRGEDGPADVEFILPPAFRAVMPWRRRTSANAWRVYAGGDLHDNMLAFTTRAPVRVRAAGFSVQIVAMGHWRSLEPLLKKVVGKIIEGETRLMGWREPETYNIVLVPTVDRGGEAYRQSFAYCFPDPTTDNRAQWANTLAHEIFHYWNYARLTGADYASTQWFQEGFTEYVANFVLLSQRIVPTEAFLTKLDEHVANSARLETTLENIGTRKGPPLYSAGALVAFAWDTAIRRGTKGRKDIGYFFQVLMRITGEGAHPYAWPDIRLALEATAAGDWEGFYQRHIRGDEDLPLAQMFAEAGLKLEGGKVSEDPAAQAAARAVWTSLQR